MNNLDILKKGNIVIPLYLFTKYKELDIELKDFIFLMYLVNKGNNITFDPNIIENDINYTKEEILEEISILTDKHLISLDVIKENNVSTEVINIDSFYSKLTLMNIDRKEEDSSIFEFIEKEFGRTLSPMEYEIIKAWIEGGNSTELIEEAVKEATFNGVNNLRYIDKILYEWNKKGIKTSEDVEKNRKNYRKKDDVKEKELFDYNWFEDDDE